VDAPTVERITWSELFVFFDDGTKLALTDEPWLSADATWDTARTERDAAGVPIGVSSMVPARLEYALPPRAVRLAARILPGKWSDAADKPIVVSVTVDRSVDHREKSGELIEVDLDELGFHGPVEVRNLWTKKSEGTFERAFSARVPFHGAALFRVLASN
jgi:hypothetical protein